MKKNAGNITSNIQVKQSNLFTMASSSWTVVERRMFYLILYHLQYLRSKKVEDNIQISIDVDFLQNGAKRTADAVAALRSLKSKNVEIKTNTEYLIVGVINYAKYSIDKKNIEIEVSHLIVPHLLSLSAYYTQYELSTALSFKSIYSQKLYELCCQHRNERHFSISVEDFLKIVGNDTKYKSEDFNNLKRRCLLPAYTEIKESKSDVFFEFQPIAEGKGKKITKIVFTVLLKDTPGLYTYADYLWYIDAQMTYYLGKRNALLANQIKFVLLEHQEWIKIFVEKLNRIITSYKTKQDITNVLKKMILNDYVSLIK